MYIKQVEESDIPERQYVTKTDHPNVPIIEHMLSELFITAGGHINYDAKDDLLRIHGYGLYPVEQDGFGWVIGGLSTSKGTIIFG